jgi:hypothetical protein
MHVARGAIEVVIADAGARYPITIDPTLVAEATSFPARSGL